MDEKKFVKKIWINILIAIIIMFYFIGINIFYKMSSKENTLIALKISSSVILAISILILEIAYKKDNGMLAINGIEALIIAFHSLFISHVVELSNYNFEAYIVTSSYFFAIYYVLKSIIIDTNEKRKYLKSLSDIKEIVVNEPVKKEPKKREK